MQTVETLIGASDPGLNEFGLIVDFLNDSYFVKNNVFNKNQDLSKSIVSNVLSDHGFSHRCSYL